MVTRAIGREAGERERLRDLPLAARKRAFRALLAEDFLGDFREGQLEAWEAKAAAVLTAIERPSDGSPPVV